MSTNADGAIDRIAHNVNQCRYIGIVAPATSAALRERLHSAADEVTTLLLRLSSVRPGPPITSQDRRRIAEQADSFTKSLASVCDEVDEWIGLTETAEQTPTAADGDTGTEALDGVAAAQAELDRASAQLHEAVELARVDGDSWRTIGAALGITGQTAHKRFDPKARQRHADYMRARYRRVREARVTD